MSDSRKQELERNAEYQRRRMMSQDERCIDARDRVAKNLHDQNMRDGKNTTFDEASRKATEIAHKSLRIKQEND